VNAFFICAAAFPQAFSAHRAIPEIMPKRFHPPEQQKEKG
jgi:hypothetical protein